MFCQNCGAQLNEGAKFCPHCGVMCTFSDENVSSKERTDSAVGASETVSSQTNTADQIPNNTAPAYSVKNYQYTNASSVNPQNPAAGNNATGTEQTINLSAEDKKKNKIMAWVMAVIPVVGTLIGWFLGFGYVCLILNIIVGYIDESNLRKQGIDTSSFGKLAFLVPYYLYKRSVVLGDDLSYTIVWVVLFVISCFI